VPDQLPTTKSGWIRRLGRECLRHRGVTVGALVASVLGVSLDAVGPLLTRVAVDDAVRGITDVLVPIVLAILGLALVRFGASFLRRYLAGRMALDVQHDLRRQVFAAVQRLDGRRQDALRTGQVASRAITDLQLVQGLLAIVPLTAGTIALVVASVAAMLWLSPLLTVVSLVMLPLAAYITSRTRRTLFPATWSAQQRAADVAQQVEETVTGVRVVKGFGQENREVSTLEGLARRLFGERLRAARMTARLNPVLLALPTLGQVAVIGVGGWMALRGSITLGTFLAFTTYVAQLVGPARLVGSLVVSAQLARAGVERVYDLVDAEPDVQDPPAPRELPEGPVTVELDGVRFGYQPGRPVLDGVSLRVEPGETLAIVGTPGSGKSTVAQLLPRFYDPWDGAVRIGGIDVRELRLRALRAELGVVFEEAFLFSDTIRNNIAYGRPDATDEEVRAAAEAAQVAAFVDALPDGLDTEVGERGLTLSGGQRQRIALARAILTDPRVLVLDDATSAVDTATEAAIHEALHALMVGRTTVLVAHRRSTIALADRVAVLDEGRLVDVGTEAELRGRCPLFRELLATAGTAEPVGAVPEPKPAVVVPAGGVTPELWPSVEDEERVESERALRTAAAQGGGGRGGLGPGAGPGAGGMVGGLAATPELLASVAALPPLKDVPRLRGADPSAPDPGFRLARLLRPVRWTLALGMVLVALDALATLAFPSVARYAVDGGITAGSTRVLMIATLVGIGIVLVDAVVVGFQTLVTARAGESLLYLLRIRSYAHLQRLGLDYFERELSGRIMTRMTTDVDALSTFLQTGLAQAVVSLLTLVGVAVALLVTDAQLALVALAVLPVLLVATVVFRRLSSRAYAEARERVGIVNADMQENVTGVRVAQAFVREERSAAQFGARSDAYRRTRIRAQRYIATYFPGVAFLSDVAQAAVLGVGAARVASGDITPGVLTAFLLYLGLFFAPVQQLSQVFDGYQQARIGLSRIADLLRTESSIQDVPDPEPAPERLRGAVELREVTFRYPGVDSPALADVSLSVRPGETVALVGATGAGKSTLVKLLARFYDVGSGALLVDGVDIRRYGLEGYRRRLGFVPQEPHLFTGDVAANIAYGRPDATPAEIEAAARAVGAIELVRGLSGGFRHPVGERGQGLTAGQRQLVALARAELVDPDVLIFDEATAALDPATEAAVLAAGDRVTARRTAFVVAHRLATAAASDRIVVLHRGRIVEEGPHRDLLEANGRYAALWRAGELEPVADADTEDHSTVRSA
jgi:ATP-binding cassette subfamily B protein